MVDRLKGATEALRAPICPTCHLDMRWFQSELVQDRPDPVIAHEFVCSHCQRKGRLETKFEPARVLPDKFAAPRPFAHAA